MVSKVVDNFRLKDQNGKIFDLYENLNNNILLVFYPLDNSRVCTEQLKNYSQQEYLFLNNNIKVIGINIGRVESHKRFCENKNIEIPLLYDKSKIVSRKFRAINFLGINKRKLVLINMNKEVVLDQDVGYFEFPTVEEIMQKIEKLKKLQKT